MTVEPLENQHPSFQEQDLSVHKLQDVSYEALSFWLTDSGHPDNLLKVNLIKELFAVARYQERFKNGEIGKSFKSLSKITLPSGVECVLIFLCLDGNTKISVMYLGSLEEESGEDNEVALSELSSLSTEQPANSSLSTTGPDVLNQGLSRYKTTLGWET